MAQESAALEEVSERPPVAHEIAAAQAAEIKRLRGWLSELSLVRGENSLAEAFARRIRYIARRALQGEPV